MRFWRVDFRPLWDLSAAGGERVTPYAGAEPNALFDKIGAPTGEITHVAKSVFWRSLETVYFVTVDQYTTLLSNEKPEV